MNGNKKVITVSIIIISVVLVLVYTVASTYSVIIDVTQENGINEIVNVIKIKDILTNEDGTYNETYYDIKQELIHKYDVTREDTINQRRNDLRNEYQRLIMFRNGGESRMPSVIDVIEDYSPQLYGPHIDETTGEEFYLEEFGTTTTYLPNKEFYCGK